MLDNKLSPKWRMQILSPAFAGAILTLTGCGSSLVGPSVPAPLPAVALNGLVHGGQQPVAGAAIQLYAANSAGGYGSNSSPLLTSPVSTSSSGTFSLAGLFTCPSAGSLVYLVATGGNPGLGSNNPNLALTAALGPCGNINSSTFIQVNELTTIASVYALAPFMSSFSAVGTSSANVQGLANAFATVNNLVNINTGAIPGSALPANAILPSSELNTSSPTSSLPA